jgi:hypothetical protein
MSHTLLVFGATMDGNWVFFLELSEEIINLVFVNVDSYNFTVAFEKSKHFYPLRNDGQRLLE